MYMENYKILTFCGSLRKDSYNRLLLNVSKDIINEMMENKIEFPDSDIGTLPHYNYDLETALPENVVALKEKATQSDLILIVSPEYNYSVPGVLKNAIDWLSRPINSNSLDKKFAVILGATTGRLGTVRGQLHLREILSALNVFVLPQPQYLLSGADQKFDDQGEFIDQRDHGKLESFLMANLNYFKGQRTI